MWWMAAIAAAQAVQSFRASQAQAAQQQAVADEQLRRTRGEHAQVVAQGASLEGASGFEEGASSLSLHLSAMQREFARQEQWQQESGAALSGATGEAGWWRAGTDITKGIFDAGKASGWGKEAPQPES
jgi:hypothetical protein